MSDLRPTPTKRPRDPEPTTARPSPTEITRVPVTPTPKLAMSPEEYDSYLATTLENSESIPTEIPVKETIGKSHFGLMCPQLPYAVDHDAIPLLQGYANDGCPVDCGADWTAEHIELMLERGPHRSATGKAAVRQLRKETEDKIKHNYARVVKWGDIKKNPPKKLKFSPVAMIPHKSKPF